MKGIYKISGIYKIQSIVKPERIYIGSAVNMGKRWSRHLTDLKKNIHGNPKLQNHYNKYGVNDLVYSLLLGCDKCDCEKTEQYFIDTYNPWFNICKIANSVQGRVCSEETKRKMSLQHKGKPTWIKGVKLSKEHKAAIGHGLKGRKNALGTHHSASEETKIKIGLGNKGKIHSVEQNEKNRIFKTGKKQSPETIAKKIKSNTGKKRSDEIKHKMSIIMKAKGITPPSRLGCRKIKIA